MKKKRTSLSNFRLIDDRTAVFGFLAFLVIVLFIFDAAADQQALFGYKSALTTTVQSSGGAWSSTATSQILTKELADQVVSKLVIDSREKDGVAFIVKDTVDLQLLDYFTRMDYETIKSQLGIQSDFVIHFEDEAGMVVPMGNRFCIGSKNAKINGVPCS
ncbi:hypothetical protein HYU40_03690 [Candidatus Woesearchaeota archaeon]|nr:hypothetical protein [Candidatus Woesearchaeota archaeon]